MRIEANSRKMAWEIADKLFPTDYIFDSQMSVGAGYDIYIGPYGDYISDLGTRLELNFTNGESKNIWILGDIWE